MTTSDGWNKEEVMERVKLNEPKYKGRELSDEEMEKDYGRPRNHKNFYDEDPRKDENIGCQVSLCAVGAYILLVVLIFNLFPYSSPEQQDKIQFTIVIIGMAGFGFVVGTILNFRWTLRGIRWWYLFVTDRDRVLHEDKIRMIKDRTYYALVNECRKEYYQNEENNKARARQILKENPDLAILINVLSKGKMEL